MRTTGIVILNYNNSWDTVECIRSIEACNTAPVKYIVVDNGSREEEVHALRSFLEEQFSGRIAVLREGEPAGTLAYANFVPSPSNDGYARGNNKGLFFAYADEGLDDVIILNNDIQFRDDIIPVLSERRKTLSRPGILTPLLRNLDGSIETPCARRFPSNWQVIFPFVLFKHDLFHLLSRSSTKQKLLLTNPELLQEQAFPIGLPSGAFMFVDKHLFREVGGFDEGTFLYYEENILCRKLADLGYENYCIPTVCALHTGGASTRKISNLFLQECNLRSADHYLKDFARMTGAQRLVWGAVKGLWQLKFRLKKHA